MTPWCTQNPKHPLVLHKIDCVHSKGLIPGSHRALFMSAGMGSLGSLGSLGVVSQHLLGKGSSWERPNKSGQPEWCSLVPFNWSWEGREKLRDTCLGGNVSPNCSAGEF